jgi:hypothetical protein
MILVMLKVWQSIFLKELTLNLLLKLLLFLDSIHCSLFYSNFSLLNFSIHLLAGYTKDSRACLMFVLPASNELTKNRAKQKESPYISEQGSTKHSFKMYFLCYFFPYKTKSVLLVLAGNVDACVSLSNI